MRDRFVVGLRAIFSSASRKGNRVCDVGAELYNTQAGTTRTHVRDLGFRKPHKLEPVHQANTGTHLLEVRNEQTNLITLSKHTLTLCDMSNLFTH